jgi:hypothetical protein
VYEALYSTGEVSVYGGGAPDDADDDENGPRAGDIPTATPVPTATPDPQIAARNDAQRVDDLERVRQGLGEYYEVYGNYPLAEGVQTLCGYSFDSGCQLDEFIDLPNDPTGASYWYQSDGETFFVFASLELPGDTSECPDPMPSHLASVRNVYCVGGGTPSAE